MNTRSIATSIDNEHRGIVEVLPIFFTAFVLWLLFGCDSAPIDQNPTVKQLKHLITSETLILNPTGYTPLAAELTLRTAQPVQVELEVVSPYDGEDNLIHRFEKIDTSFTLPVLGLYASHQIMYKFDSMIM